MRKEKQIGIRLTQTELLRLDLIVNYIGSRTRSARTRSGAVRGLIDLYYRAFDQEIEGIKGMAGVRSSSHSQTESSARLKEPPSC